MNKEDILKKAQKEGNNEYEQQTYDRIVRWGILAIVALCAFFWLAEFVSAKRAGLDAVNGWAFPAIAVGYAAFIELLSYAKLKMRRQLGAGLLFLLAFAIYTAMYFVHL